MNFNADALFSLLPAIHRIRDAELAAAMGSHLMPGELVELDALEQLPNPTAIEKARRDELRVKAGKLLTPAELVELRDLEILPAPSTDQVERIRALREKTLRGPLKALSMVFADELAVMEENLAQLYDDAFIETCADWAIPYIGDLIGYEPLHARGQARGLARAEVAHTIALRRRKGTAAVLEQLARDVTGWNARAVEYFQLLGATQYMNHLRPHCLYAPDLRRWEPLARMGSAFESVMHTVDVRRIESRRGRFNIPNVGIFLWRLNAYPHTQSPAVRVDDRRYLVSPLGHPLPLFSNPIAEDEITHLADPINVPEPIGRRTFDARKAAYYGTRDEAPPEPADNAEPSIVLYADGIEVLRKQVCVCNLADDGAAWAHVPSAGMYAIDPVLGRIALAPDVAVPDELLVTYHYGFSADIGGGEYPRERARDATGTVVRKVPVPYATIQAALDDLPAGGVVEITDSGRYEETLSVVMPENGTIVLRAAERQRPTLILGGEMTVRGGANSAFVLDGVLVAGNRLRAPDVAGNELARLRILHTTLVPGHALDEAGDPVSPGAESLLVELPNVAIEVERTILGALRISDMARLVATDSIIDANDPTAFAYCAPDGSEPGGELSLIACTVIGKINATVMELISNSLLLARAAAADTLPPVHAVRRQTGCVRFTFLPFGSLVPRRYRCQPESGGSNITPHFTSLRYGVAAYCQLARSTPDEIRRGADDESEMGAFHMLFPAQREANLQIRLREFLRVGLSSGIFYET